MSTSATSPRTPYFIRRSSDIAKRPRDASCKLRLGRWAPSPHFLDYGVRLSFCPTVFALLITTSLQRVVELARLNWHKTGLTSMRGKQCQWTVTTHRFIRHSRQRLTNSVLSRPPSIGGEIKTAGGGSTTERRRREVESP